MKWRADGTGMPPGIKNKTGRGKPLPIYTNILFLILGREA